MRSFFDRSYKTPKWFEQWLDSKMQSQQQRRAFLKSAAGVSSAAIFASKVTAAPVDNNQVLIQKLTQTDPWLTLNVVLEHLLPQSDAGPSAVDIQALPYLMNVILEQPIAEEEKQFVFKGVGWLNGFSKSEKGKPFVELNTDEKEAILRGISQSQAGENWLNTLLIYIFEAMLSPPSYGGNPDGIGWKWLEHQAGFPLPKSGSRYYELPVQRGKTKQYANSANVIKVNQIQRATKS